MKKEMKDRNSGKDDGEILKKEAMLNMLEDLEENKKKLQESEAKYKAIIENTIDMIYTYDLTGKIIFITPNVSRYGYSADDVIGHNILDFVHHDDKKKVIADLKRTILGGEEIPTEVRLMKKDGTPVYIEEKSKVVREGLKFYGVGVIRDITDRKKVEKSLIDSEEKYRVITEKTGGLVYDYDVKSGTISWNGAIKELTGYALKEFQKVDIKGWERMIHPDDRKNALSLLNEAEKRCSRYKVEYRFKTKGGEYNSLLDQGVFLPDKSGKAVRMLGVMRDITDSKKAEAALRESESNYRALIENATDQIFMIDKDYKIISMNEAAASLSRKTPDEMIGVPISKIFPKEIAIQFSNNIKEVFKTGKSKSIEEKMTVQGKEFYNSTQLNPIKDDKGNVTSVMGIVRDVTESKKVEISLRESEELFRTLFDYAPDAYYMSDLKGVFIDANKAAERMSGYKKDELIGKSFIKAGIMLKDQIPKALKLLAMNALGRPTGPDELDLMTKEGRRFSVEINTYPVRMKGRLIVLGIAREMKKQ